MFKTWKDEEKRKSKRAREKKLFSAGAENPTALR
jgi:hypothetical protein